MGASVRLDAYNTAQNDCSNVQQIKFDPAEAEAVPITGQSTTIDSAPPAIQITLRFGRDNWLALLDDVDDPRWVVNPSSRSLITSAPVLRADSQERRRPVLLRKGRCSLVADSALLIPSSQI